MSDLDRQIAERIYRHMGKGERCGHPLSGRHCSGWIRPGAPLSEHVTLPDPYADTPEGDHAFMEIVRWADTSGYLFEMSNGYGWSVIFLAGSPEAKDAKANHDSFKAALLAALADAIGETRAANDG